MARSHFVVMNLITLWLLHSCCDSGEIYHNLPTENGKYYIDNDTIRFYSAELDQVETYLVCYEHFGSDIDENSSFFCKQTVIYESSRFHLNRDGCESNRHFEVIGSTRSESGFVPLINAQYEQGVVKDYSRIDKTKESQTVDIMGYTYNDVTYCIFEDNDSLVSVIHSIEFGIVQYSFDHATFSLIRDLKQIYDR